MATQCAGVGSQACHRRCKPAAIRTLAYVMNECRTDAAGMQVGHQALRIRRGDREPITVLEFGPSEPAPDPLGLCRQYGQSRAGTTAIVSGLFQRMGLSPDGSGVVFEVNPDARIVPVGNGPAPDLAGMFFVRSDGRGRRRVGPASRDRCYRISADPTKTFIFNVNAAPGIPFTPNGRRIAFTDLGPGPGGEEAVQIVVLDLATGQRTQVTHLPSGPPNDTAPGTFLTAYPRFIDDETVLFFTFVDPDGSNPTHDFAPFTVRIDGSGLKRKPDDTPLPGTLGGRVLPVFGVTQLATDLFTLSVPGTPVNPTAEANPIAEVFVQDGKNILQLTKFGRVDTGATFLSVASGRAFFTASADPLGTNPSNNCQLFSVDTLGSGLRQMTRFNNPGSPATQPACWNGQPPACVLGAIFQDPVTKAVVFHSSCDPLHANPFGDQLFAMRPDGLGLRQLTDAAGFTTDPDGSIRVQLPGPLAYSAERVPQGIPPR
jgi:hypothetical protein